MMDLRIQLGLWLPFIGTMAGSACVLFLKNQLNDRIRKGLTGFAAGVMVSASFFSLILPAMDQAATLWPVITGFWAGILFLLVLDIITPHLHMNSDTPEGPGTHLKRSTMLMLAVTLHNIPEGMAVGVVLASVLQGQAMTFSAALALAIGIAIQNFPEGAIISMPLKSEGMSKPKAFWFGTLSGAVEPAAGIVTLLFAASIQAMLPFLLSLAAGAMMYVVVEELIPEMSEGTHSNWGTILFSAGFTLMLVLDTILG